MTNLPVSLNDRLIAYECDEILRVKRRIYAIRSFIGRVGDALGDDHRHLITRGVIDRDEYAVRWASPSSESWIWLYRDCTWHYRRERPIFRQEWGEGDSDAAGLAKALLELYAEEAGQ